MCQNRSIAATAGPKAAIDPNFLGASPIFPSQKSKCQELVGAEVIDAASNPTIAPPLLFLFADAVDRPTDGQHLEGPIVVEKYIRNGRLGH
jgi:hypothetical protein